MLNSKDINLLRPDVAANCKIFLDRCAKAGYIVRVTGTVRDNEYQMQCFKTGHGGRPPATFHSVDAGLAFDIVKLNPNGSIDYNDHAFWKGVSTIGKAMGFTWGGDWKGIVDCPHFQWDAHGRYNGANIRAKKYPPKMPLFKEEADMTHDEVMALINANKPVVWNTFEEVPAWGQPTVKKLMDKGVLNGTDSGLGLNFDQLRVLVLNDRAGMYN